MLYNTQGKSFLKFLELYQKIQRKFSQKEKIITFLAKNFILILPSCLYFYFLLFLSFPLSHSLLLSESFIFLIFSISKSFQFFVSYSGFDSMKNRFFFTNISIFIFSVLMHTDKQKWFRFNHLALNHNHIS